MLDRGERHHGGLTRAGILCRSCPRVPTTARAAHADPPRPAEAILAAYRVADSPPNIVTPIMAYFPLIVIFAARYDRRSGIGTVIALMLPYFVAALAAWTAFFMLWYALGLPWGNLTQSIVVPRAPETPPSSPSSPREGLGADEVG